MALVAVIGGIALLGVTSIGRIRRRSALLILSAGILLTLLIAHWKYVVSIPEGIASQSWPSVNAALVRVNEQTLGGGGIEGPKTIWRLDMPYLYMVDGHPYRGTRFSVAGDFIGTREKTSEFQSEGLRYTRAFYNPTDPKRSVLFRGVSPFRFNVRSLMPLLILGLLLGYTIVRRPMAVSNVSPVAKSSTEIAGLSTVVAVMAMVWAGLEFVRYGGVVHGQQRDYKVFAEIPMEGGLEYSIGVNHFWGPWRDRPGGAEWYQDVRDTEFIAVDGSLKPIVVRRWKIYQFENLYKTDELPGNVSPDWIMTWSHEIGIKTDPVSERATKSLEKNGWAN